MKIKKYLYLFLLLTSSNLCFCKVIFVNGNTIGGLSNGASWENAFLDFQDAIAEAIYGDSIWVAQGTYFPTSSNDREISFELKNGVKWFGGFQGNEQSLSQRDFNVNLTTLSGDIGTLGIDSDNSHHVVYTIGVDSMSILDGFNIVDGHAITSDTFANSSYHSGGGLLIDADSTYSEAKPQIRNCVFQNNKGLYGGAISYGHGYTNFHINPKINNCQFISNEATVIHAVGGAISLIGGSKTVVEPIIISNCVFENNKSNRAGGSIYLREIINEFNILNCDFIGNQTYGPSSGGGAITYSASSFDDVTKVEIANCDFENNHSIATGGAISFGVGNIFPEEESVLIIDNCNFRNNYIESTAISGSVISYGSSAKNSKAIIVNSNFIENGNNGYALRIGFSPVLPADFEDRYGLEISGCNFIENEECIYFKSFTTSGVEGYFTLVNSTFIKNISQFNRPIIWIEKNTTQDSTLKGLISNSLFFKNEGGIRKKYADTTFVLDISNSIFWEDMILTELFDDDNFISDLDEGFNIHHSLLKSPDCIVNGVDLCGDGMLFNQYPEFRDTLNGDFSLRSCSPAINQGDNASIDSLGIVFDIEGNPRFIDQVVDMGAYETQAFESFTPQIQDESCAEVEDGSVFWVQHGTPPFDFEWNNGITSGNNMSNLSAGNYSFTVTDADSCMEVINIEIDAPLPLLVMDTITHATAINAADGSINLMPSGGTSDYDFIWENGDTTAILNNLIAGFYQVTVTDANGCFLELEYEVEVVTAVDNSFEQTKIQLLPNISPKNISINLWIENDKNEYFEIEILNELGQVIFYKKIKTQGGKNVYKIPAPQSAGLFFVKIKNKEGAQRVLKYMVL